MRRLSVAIPLLVLLALAPAACKRHTVQKTRAVPGSVDDGLLVSALNVADPGAVSQLTRGFHGLEANAWRWVMRNFVVTMRPPAIAARNGATLELKFVIPDEIANRLGAITLSAKVNGLALAPQTYPQAGEFIYSREVPAVALADPAVMIEFSTDKAMPPGNRDERELAILVKTIGLTAK